MEKNKAILVGVIVSILLCQGVLFSACQEEGEFKDGVYQAEIEAANDYMWAPRLEVVVEGGSFVAASFDYLAPQAGKPQDEQTGSAEPGIGAKPDNSVYEGMTEQLVESESADIDTITGATRTVKDFNRLAQSILDSARRGGEKEIVLQEQRESYKTAQKNLSPGSLEEGENELAVVSAHYLATEAGIDILEKGGTAADAAFAVAAVLTVTEPWFSSILGGGTWALYYDSEADRVRALDGVGPAASGATAEMFSDPAYGGASGLHQAVVPGAWGGWMTWLKEYGSLPLTELMEPAVQLAENGVPVSEAFARWVRIDLENIKRWERARETYLIDGKAPEAGDVLEQKDMAETFRELISVYEKARLQGEKEAFQAAADYFYRGPLAEQIVDFSKQNGGLFELSDFNSFEAAWTEPLTADYKGVTVYQCPPNSQGITMLMGLNILKGFDFSQWDINSPENIHVQTEAIKLAHVDKYYHVGDPAYNDIPVDRLLSEEHYQAQRDRIDMDEAMEWPIPDILSSQEDSHTTTFHVYDSYGNAAAVTTSLGAQFLPLADTGILINNRMRMMDFEEGNPNRIEPGKKVRHTSNPYMAFKGGVPYILGGNTGVDTQPQGQIQQFISVYEYGLSPQEAVSRPRFVTRAFPAGYYPHKPENVLAMEGGFPESLKAALRRRGHTIVSNAIFGNANMVVINRDETREIESIETGADPRGANLGLVR